jgi:hypothetical protein
MNELQFPLDRVEIYTEVAPSIRFYLPDKMVPGVRVELTIETHFPEEEGILMYRAWVRRDMVGVKVLHCEGSIEITHSQPFDAICEKLIATINMRPDFMERLDKCLNVLQTKPGRRNSTLS